MEEKNELTSGEYFVSFLIFLTVFLGALWYLVRPRNVPPGPFNPFIIFTIRRKAYLRLTELAKAYGPIYSIRFGKVLTVVLNDITVVKEALLDNADIFADRFVSSTMKIASQGTKGSIMHDNGTVWKEMRRFGLQSLRKFGLGRRSLANKIQEETSHLLKAVSELNGKPFRPRHVISNAVANIICSISFGDRYNYDDPKFHQLLEILHFLTSAAAAASPTHIIPYLIYLPPFRRVFAKFEVLKKFITDIVDEHRDTLDPNDSRDVIDMFLLEAKEQKKQGSKMDAFDETRVWRTIVDLFGAGSDTTSNTLLWAMAIMCHYPDVQRKVYEEIKASIGTERLPTYEDRTSLPYTEAVLMEVLRFRPTVPVIIRKNITDVSIGGYNIPKGSRIFVNIWATEHDPARWADPESFIPERFLSPEGQTIVQNEAHIPFCAGRRVCIGEILAKMELIQFFGGLIQRFHLSVPQNQQLPVLDGLHGITLCAPEYEICAEPRT